MGLLWEPPANKGTFLELTNTIYCPFEVIIIYPRSLNAKKAVFSGQSMFVRVLVRYYLPWGLISNTLTYPTLVNPNKYLSE